MPLLTYALFNISKCSSQIFSNKLCVWSIPWPYIPASAYCYFYKSFPKHFAVVEILVFIFDKTKKKRRHNIIKKEKWPTIRKVTVQIIKLNKYVGIGSFSIFKSLVPGVKLSGAVTCTLFRHQAVKLLAEINFWRRTART
jgi:hypothetical protein